jgi:hypothetical protein
MYTWKVDLGISSRSTYGNLTDFCSAMMEDYKRVFVKPERIIMDGVSVGLMVYDFLVQKYPENANVGLFYLVDKDGNQVER